MSNKRCTLFESSKEGGLKGGCMIYFVRGKDCWGPTLDN